VVRAKVRRVAFITDSIGGRIILKSRCPVVPDEATRYHIRRCSGLRPDRSETMKDSAESLDAEIERERLERVEDLASEDGAEWASHAMPGTFGCHELLDRTMIAFNLVEEMIVSHPACVQNREWYALAHRAFKALEILYERVGEVHLSNDADEPDSQDEDESD